jgi:hypothetical protein
MLTPGAPQPGALRQTSRLRERLCCGAAIQRGWNNEVDFRVSPELAAELAALGEAERKAHERKERNKQSASAARAKRRAPCPMCSTTIQLLTVLNTDAILVHAHSCSGPPWRARPTSFKHVTPGLPLGC